MSTRRALAAALLLGLAEVAGSGCSDSSAETPTAQPAEAAPVETRHRVRTQLVARTKLDAEELAAGIVRAHHNARVTAETAGRVVRRAVERGAEVAQGDLLLELDATRLEIELRRAEATLRARANDLAHAKREHARGEQLVLEKAISEQHRDDLRHALDRASDEHALAVVARDAARRALADTRIAAPFAGRVDDLFVDIGDYVAPGTPVATVVDLTRARVFAGVTAQEAAALGERDEAVVRFAALGGQALRGRLASVARVASERDGTYAVEIWIDDAPAALRDGMVASVDLPTKESDSLPVVPRSALMRRAGQPEVFVIERSGGSDWVARLREVRTGRTAGEWIEVLDGVSEGDAVVVDGQFALRDGANVVVDQAPASAR